MNFFKKLFGKKEESKTTPAPPKVEEQTPKPEDLSRLQDLVEPLIRSATQFKVTKANKPSESSHLKSHFGGDPYFEEGELWPRKSDGEPLDFIFQIFNTGDIDLPAEVKLIQLYYDYGDLAFDTEDEGWKVKIYTELRQEKLIKLIRPQDLEDGEEPDELEQVPYCEISFEATYSLPSREEVYEHYGEVQLLSREIDAGNAYDSYQIVADNLIGEKSFSSQIGGYPYWVQNSDTPLTKKGESMKLLFQLDSEDEADLMWGDGGLIYIFYDPEDISHLEYTLQCF